MSGKSSPKVSGNHHVLVGDLQDAVAFVRERAETAEARADAAEADRRTADARADAERARADRAEDDRRAAEADRRLVLTRAEQAEALIANLEVDLTAKDAQLTTAVVDAAEHRSAADQARAQAQAAQDTAEALLVVPMRPGRRWDVWRGSGRRGGASRGGADAESQKVVRGRRRSAADDPTSNDPPGGSCPTAAQPLDPA